MAKPRHSAWFQSIVRSHESVTLEREVFAEGLFSSRTDTPTRLAKMFLVYQNGEACTACPVVCTEGLVGLLERFAARAETRDMLAHLKEGRDGDFAIGAQFLTEIHGGSDVPANRVEAVEGPDGWRLHGTKFFCSVVHADYAVVTAKPQGSGHLAAFAMPMWDRGAFRERRNRYTINRLKWKLGTGELPTAELTLDEAQRLFRKICPVCRREIHPDPVVLERNHIRPDFFEGGVVYGPVGCPKCNSTGYKGRNAVMEVLTVNAEIRDAIARSIPSPDIQAMAVKEGMLTLRMDGLKKIERGVTTLEEVVKETAA